MIAVFVHPNNRYVDSLTSDQLGQLFSGSVAWGDVISGAPNVVPNLYIADPLSGTFDFFESASGTRLPREGGYSDDVSLLAGAKNDENALGFVPLAFVLDSNAVKVVDVDCVDPTTTTNPESYNFFRPLFFYYDENSASSAVKRYICGLMNQDGQRIVTDSGYVQIPQSLISSNVRTLGCSGLSTPTRTYTGINKQFTYCRDMNEITLSGSSTVYPFAQQLAIENPNTWLYPVSGSSSSGVGIRTFLAGATDIGTASRALKDSDYSALGCDPNLVVDSIASGPCQGILPKGAVVGRDMLAVIVNTANPISSAGISSIGLKDIFTGLTTWSSIGTTSRQIPQAVGTATVKYCIPDPLSGTHSFFEDYIGAEITRDVTLLSLPLMKKSLIVSQAIRMPLDFWGVHLSLMKWLLYPSTDRTPSLTSRSIPLPARSTSITMDPTRGTGRLPLNSFAKLFQTLELLPCPRLDMCPSPATTLSSSK